MRLWKSFVLWLDRLAPGLVPASLLAPVVLRKDALYKVVGPDGRYNVLAWSLPQGGKPGEWHTKEERFFLTRRPRHWWLVNPKEFRIYVAEGEDVLQSGADVAIVKKARLLRETTDVERRALRCAKV
jgi:hypothetical protein